MRNGFVLGLKMYLCAINYFKDCTSMYSWRTCYPSDARGASAKDAVPMSIPKYFRPSAILGVDARPASDTDYCCQTYVPFSDEDRRTSRDHPQSRPFVHQQLVSEASSRWVLHRRRHVLFLPSKNCLRVLGHLK